MSRGYVRDRIRKWKSNKEERERHEPATFGPIANDGESVWVWAKDPEGRICGKQIPKSWLKKDDMLVPIEMVNEDLEMSRRMAV